MSNEVHCKYCMCPKEIWKPVMKNYNGDECKLYSDFTDVISELEGAKKSFGNQEIIEKCRKDFEEEYTDISDFKTSVNEMIQINVSEGYMPKNYVK